MASIRIITSKVPIYSSRFQSVLNFSGCTNSISCLTKRDACEALVRPHVSLLVRPHVSQNVLNFSTARGFDSNVDGSTYPYTDLNTYDMTNLTNQDLEDTSTIPGWDLVHSPPRKFPRGALIGKVVSDKMSKTVNVAVDRYTIAPKVRKRIRYTRKFMAHDEGEVSKMGDLVMITPCQRISRHKHFMLREIIRPKGQL